MYERQKLELEATKLIEFAEKIHTRKSLKYCLKHVEKLKRAFYDKSDTSKYSCSGRCEYCVDCNENCHWKFLCKICYKKFPWCVLRMKKKVLTSDSIPMCHIPKNCDVCCFFYNRKKASNIMEECEICKNNVTHCTIHCPKRFSKDDHTKASKIFIGRNKAPNKCALCAGGHNQSNCLHRPAHLFLNKLRRRRRRKNLNEDIIFVGIVTKKNRRSNGAERAMNSQTKNNYL